MSRQASQTRRGVRDTDAYRTELPESSQQSAFEARRVAGETEASQQGYEPLDRADNEIGQIDASGEHPDEVLLDYGKAARSV